MVDQRTLLLGVSGAGTEILGRLPERSPIQDSTNPGHKLVMESIGPEFDNIFDDVITNCDARFLQNATDTYLTMLGTWFGVDRNGMDDPTYRLAIISRVNGDYSLAGLRASLAILLGINPLLITFINGNDGCCFTGKSEVASHYYGTTQVYAGHYTRESGVITISVPSGSDLTLIEANLSNMILLGVLTWIVEV